jgi:hypothetical protein
MLIDALIATGHLEQNDVEPRRPVVQLTERGMALMKGTANLDGSLPIPREVLLQLDGDEAPGTKSKPSKPDETPAAGKDLPPPSPDVVGRLKKWRSGEAVAASVPAYFILTNRTLEEIARCRPRTLAELAGVKGVGPAKLQQYGQAVLDVLVGGDPPPPGDCPDFHVSENGTVPFTATRLDDDAEEPGPFDSPPDDAGGPPLPMEPDVPIRQSEPDRNRPPAVRPAHYWTWRLLSKGFSAEEAAAIRRLDREVIVDHALQALEDGLPLRPEWCLTPELLAALKPLIGRTPPLSIRQLLPHLPAGTRYEEVDLYLKCRRQMPQGDSPGGVY